MSNLTLEVLRESMRKVREIEGSAGPGFAGIRIYVVKNWPVEVVGHWIFQGPLWFAKLLTLLRISPWVSIPMMREQDAVMTANTLYCSPRQAQNIQSMLP